MFQFSNKQVSLECKVKGNPLERIYWMKNNVVISNDDLNKKIEQHDLNIESNYLSKLTTVRTMK